MPEHAAEHRPANRNDAHAGIIRKPLLEAMLAGGKAVRRVEIKQIDFAPGQRTGYHLHPCPVVGYIAKGSAYFQLEGEAPRRLAAGDAFYEPAGAPVAHFDNASASEGLTFIAFYLLGEGESELIRMLE